MNRNSGKNIIAFLITVVLHIIVLYFVGITPAQPKAEIIEVEFIKYSSKASVIKAPVVEEKVEPVPKKPAKQDYKIETVEKSDIIIPPISDEIAEVDRELYTPGSDFVEKEDFKASSEFASSDNDSENDSENRRGSSDDDLFLISWEGEERDIISKVMPGYPEDLQVNAVIRLKFQVDRDGKVTRILPLQKDNPRLEELSRDALSKWLFSPASGDVWGVITFKFLLQ